VLVALPLRLLADGSLSIPMNFVDQTAIGASAGTITVTESAYGLVFTPALTGLPAGKHGYPWGDGHLGDLPPLYVGGDGVANQPVLGPRLKRADLKGRSLMIHAGGDNHADHPAPLGGGGARIVCGAVP
jgi:Cu-Zn family superoxide dismutase